MGWTKLRHWHGLDRYGVRTVELPPNLFNRATPTIVPVDVEEVLQPVLWQQPIVRLHTYSTGWASAPWDWDRLCQDEHLGASLPSSSLPSRAPINKGHTTASCPSTSTAGSPPAMQAPSGLAEGLCGPWWHILCHRCKSGHITPSCGQCTHRP